MADFYPQTLSATVQAPLNSIDLTPQYALGFMVTDQNTGIEYQYVQFNTGSATASLAVANAPVGIYLASANALAVNTVVTTDTSLTAGIPVGTLLYGTSALPFTTLYYGWIRRFSHNVAIPALVASTSTAQGNTLAFGTDGLLNTVLTTDPTARLIALDTDTGLRGYINVIKL